MMELGLLLIGLGFGMGLGGYLRSRLHKCPDMSAFTSTSILPRGERFTVLFSTDNGGAARRLYENANGAGQGVIELYDGDQLRGSK